MAKLAASFTYSDQELLDLWREAEAKLAAGALRHEVLPGLMIERVDLDKVAARIRYLEQRIDRATRGIPATYGRYKSG